MANPPRRPATIFLMMTFFFEDFAFLSDWNRTLRPLRAREFEASSGAARHRFVAAGAIHRGFSSN